MLLAVALALFYQVFGRYVIGRAPGWTEEVARMLVAWMAMLGAAACLRDGGHIAVGALVNALPAGLRTLLLAVRDLAILATAGVLGWAGARFATLNGSQESAALEIPMSIPYSAMSVGAVLLALMLILARMGGETPPTIRCTGQTQEVKEESQVLPCLPPLTGGYGGQDAPHP